MPEQREMKPIVGHSAAWGLTGSRFRVVPYRITPGATDTMKVRVREKIDIHGVGTDVVELEGSFIVRRDHPVTVGAAAPEWGKVQINTEFRSLELYGESPVFGTVRVHLDPSQVSSGLVSEADPDSLAAKCVADLHPVVELPELGMRLTTGGQPVRLASKVVQVPPIGDVARSETSPRLIDESGNVVGEFISSDVEVGEVLLSMPLGATAPQVAQPPLSRGPVVGSFGRGSGTAFFTRPLS